MWVKIRLLLGILLLLVVGCTRNPDMLVIGAIEDTPAVFPLLNAYFSELIIRDSVRIQFYSSEHSLNKALTKNRVDVAFLPFVWCVRNAGNNIQTPLLTPLQREGAALLSPQDNLTLSDLKNSSIGYMQAQNLSSMLRILNKRDSLNMQLTGYKSSARMFSDLKKGTIRAATHTVPYLFEYIGSNTPFLWLGDEFPMYPSTSVLVSPQIAANKSTISRMRQLAYLKRGIQITSSFINGYPTQSYKTYVTIMNATSKASRLTLRRLRYNTFISPDLSNYYREIAREEGNGIQFSESMFLPDSVVTPR
ncbi:MAG: hypothetical protein K8S56_08710 [Candidatus Cloacimonetes bacterium]|nr:hypothetical protein [Candidatus Cloacimonadota bacterium]